MAVNGILGGSQANALQADKITTTETDVFGARMRSQVPTSAMDVTTEAIKQPGGAASAMAVADRALFK